jgi:hypothetical protein
VPSKMVSNPSRSPSKQLSFSYGHAELLGTVASGTSTSRSWCSNNQGVAVTISEVVLAVLALVAGFQLYVSLRLLFYSGYTVVQKATQLLIVWLVPLFGAIIVHSFLVADTARPAKRDTAFISDGGNNPPGIQ